MRDIILSGIQPTHSLTLGNYLGAIKNWVALQGQSQCYFMVVNQHAITVRQDPAALKENTLFAVATYLAAGLDYKKHVLFVQSDVPEHTQLAWILNCMGYMGEVSRMTQFKDKSARSGANIPVGLFTYPLLMAADILLYDTKLVPVGHDQKQHVELTRDLAQRMNQVYGDGTVVVPEVFIPDVAARVMDLQEPTKKMSKSASSEAGVVFLSDTAKEIEKKLKRAVTDSGSDVSYEPQEKPGVSNLIDIQSAILKQSREDIVAAYEGKMYGHLKVETAAIINEELEPIRQKTAEYLADRGELLNILEQGAERARQKARVTLERVYDRVGLSYRV
jgi:tryptophanyl-tRNA synthetase